MVEAVIALPVLILIFVSMLYVRDQVLARQQADTLARSCAWLYSAQNCTGPAPAGCGDVLGELTNTGAKNPALEEKLRGGMKTVLEGSELNDVVTGIVTDLLDPAIEAALGKSVPARAQQEVARPGVYGGGIKTVQGKYDIACNLSFTTPEDVAEDAWNMLPFP
jgi:hypothetical protein